MSRNSSSADRPLNEGVRRLSLALGLVFSLPWGFLMGATCIRAYVVVGQEWEQQFSDAALHRRARDLSEALTKTRTALARIDGQLDAGARHKGMPTFDEIMNRPLPADLENARAERPELAARVWQSEHLLREIYAYIEGTKEKPRKPSLRDDPSFYKALGAFLLTPFVYLLFWGGVRGTAWIVEGFRVPPDDE